MRELHTLGLAACPGRIAEYGVAIGINRKGRRRRPVFKPCAQLSHRQDATARQSRNCKLNLPPDEFGVGDHERRSAVRELSREFALGQGWIEWRIDGATLEYAEQIDDQLGAASNDLADYVTRPYALPNQALCGLVRDSVEAGISVRLLVEEQRRSPGSGPIGK